MRYSKDDYGWGRYVPVAERKQNALMHVDKLRKNGKACAPIVISGRNISNTFWGKSWCLNLESYSDYSNRLPRGRTYVRNGSVIDLQISKGKIDAQVMGSSLYRVTITVKPIAEQKWKSLVKACAGQVDSMIELLQGKFSNAVMEIITRKGEGLFPKPQEISMKCSCPDSATMCKHVASVLYGIGASLDTKPEALFSLRDVDHFDLIAASNTNDSLLQFGTGNAGIDADDLSALFGIEIDSGNTAPLASIIQKAPATLPKKKVTKATKVTKAPIAEKAPVAKAAIKVKGAKLVNASKAVKLANGPKTAKAVKTAAPKAAKVVTPKITTRKTVKSKPKEKAQTTI